MAKDYYQILKVTKTASEEEIKKAYRKLAHEYHPDKPGGNEAKFKEINEAYQVLSDKTKRTQYDRFGSAGVNGAGAGGFGGNWGGFNGAGGQSNWEGFGAGFDPQNVAGMGDFGDIFESIFEGFGGQPRRKTYEKGSDLEIQEVVTLEEVFSGVVKILKIKTYDASSINVLSQVEGIRQNPGLYLGDIDANGTTQCVKEILQNATDEMKECGGGKIFVKIEGRRITIADEGRGIPVDLHSKTKKTALETVMTRLHAGGKSGDKTAYGGKTIGVHGVGASVVNALSDSFSVWSFRVKNGGV
jgi:curved DNA-binding protein CbpA